MRLLLLLACILLACGDASAQQVANTTTPLRCGPCDAGYAWGAQCIMPGLDVDPVAGLPPADTGERDVFSPASYPGSDFVKVGSALAAAASVGGAVVLDRVYEIDRSLFIAGGVMITGGGLRRKCSPVATVTSAAASTDNCVEVDSTTGFDLGVGVQYATDNTYAGSGLSAPTWFGITSKSDTQLCAGPDFGFDIPQGSTLFVRDSWMIGHSQPQTGVVIDSIFLDGAARCNAHTHSWVYMNGIVLRGDGGDDLDNAIRNSVFYNHPSEAVTWCGGRIENNRAYGLYGSFVHKSCASADDPLDVYSGNYVHTSNIATNEITGHSEGVFTFSANAGNTRAYNNVLINGAEGAWGYYAVDDDPIFIASDCYHGFERVISSVSGGDKDAVSFHGRLENVARFWEDEP